MLPRLRGAGLTGLPGAAWWPCAVFAPGRSPLDELAVRVAPLARADAGEVRRGLASGPEGFALTARQAALARAEGPAGGPGDTAGLAGGERRLLLVVDQFEQAFTRCEDEAERRAFIGALCAAAGAESDGVPGALVVLAVRADFEVRCAAYPALTGAIQDRYLLSAMTARQLRAAITGPATVVESRVEDELAQVLLEEVGARQTGGAGAGVLPLLSHALDQAWRSKTGASLTLADYERTGGIEAAVAASAERAYARLTPSQQDAARQVFTRLAAAGLDGADTADRATRTELAEGRSPAQAADVTAVLEAFAGERLLTLAADSVEISHEALLTAWPLLRDTWLADTRADRVILTRLRNAATEWSAHHNDPSYLYRGHLLAATAETTARLGAAPDRYPALGSPGYAFLRASQRASRRRTMRLRGAIATLIALVVGLAATTVADIRASQAATKQRDIATAGGLAAQSGALADTNPVLAQLLSVASWRLHPSGQARDAMLNAAASPGIAQISSIPSGAVTFGPDGKELVIGRDDGTVQLLDAATGKPAGSPFAPGNSAINAFAFSADGTILGIGRQDGTVQVWNMAFGRQLGRTFRAGSDAVDSLAFVADGNILATGTMDGTLRAWHVATGTPASAPIHVSAGPLFAMMYGPAGPGGVNVAVVSNSGDNTVVSIWDVTSGRRVDQDFTAAGTGALQEASISQDPITVAFAASGTLSLWNLDDGQLVATSIPVGNASYSLAISSDGKTLATDSIEGDVRLWSAARSQPAAPPIAALGEPLALSSNGTTVTTASLDGGRDAEQRWNVATGQEVGAAFTFPVGSGFSAFLALSADGRTLAVQSSDTAVQLWDVASREPIGSPFETGNAQLSSLALSADGKTLATGSADGTVRLWDVSTRKQIGKPLLDSALGVFSLAFSPDGKTLAASDLGGQVQLLDVDTHKLVAVAAGSIGNIASALAFSPDGETLAVGSADGTVQLWDIQTGQRIGNPQLINDSGASVEALVFTPDDKILVASNYSDPQSHAVQLWDVQYLVNTKQYLCDAAGRTLTLAEWAQYAPGQPYQSVCP